MLKSVGLEDVDITPHAVRRTGATLIVRETSLEAAAEVLEHGTTGPTKSHYAEPAQTANPVSARVLHALALEEGFLMAIGFGAQPAWGWSCG